MAQDKTVQYLIEFLVKLKGNEFAVKAVKEMSKSVAESEKAIDKYNKALERGTQAQVASRGGMSSWITDIKNIARNALMIAPVWMTIRQGITMMLDTIKNGVNFLKDWEYQLAQIKMTGGATADEIKMLGIDLLSLSKNLGISNKELGETAKLIIQQGRALNEVMPMLEAVARFSMLTGKSMTEGLDALTAVLEGFDKKVSDSMGIIDSLEAVELKNAITVDVLASGIEQMAAIANEFNITFEESLGIITAVHETTRDKGSKIGQMWKTIFTRMNTDAPKALKEIANVTTYLDDFGRETKMITNNMIPMSQRIIDLANKWNTLSESQKAHLTNTLGGKRAINIIMAYLQNYEGALQAEANALFGAGEAVDKTNQLTETFQHTVESLGNSWKIFLDTLTDLEALKDAVKLLKEFINLITYGQAPERVNYEERTKELEKQSQELEKQLTLNKGIETSFKRTEEFAKVAERTPAMEEKLFKQVSTAFFPKLKERYPEIEKVSTFSEMKNFIEQKRPELQTKTSGIELQQIMLKIQKEKVQLQMQLAETVRKTAIPESLKTMDLLKSYSRTVPGLKQEDKLDTRDFIFLKNMKEKIRNLKDLSVIEEKNLIRIFKKMGNNTGEELINSIAQKSKELSSPSGKLQTEFKRLEAEKTLTKLVNVSSFGYSEEQQKAIDAVVNHQLEIAKARGATEEDLVKLKYQLRQQYYLETNQLEYQLEIEKARLAVQKEKSSLNYNIPFYTEESSYEDEFNRYLIDTKQKLESIGIIPKERKQDFTDIRKQSDNAEVKLIVRFEGETDISDENANKLLNNSSFKDGIKKIVVEGINEEIDEKRGW